ncbi:MAG: mismatch-specific DNA-glycosylase [Terriglobia bacterium]
MAKKASQNGPPQRLPDYLRPGLKLVFVGYNPGLRSARLGHYYAGRGNQFWPFLTRAGFVAERLTFSEDSRLLEFGMGLTDIVKRPSRGAAELTVADYRRGRALLREKIRRYRPRALAFVGKGVYERFAGRRVSLGLQPESVFGARVFVLPSTSGANASVSRQQKLRYFCQLARWLNRVPASA